MTPRDKKLAFLRQLSQESEPITVSAILGKMRLGYTDRTVRRWLQQLVNEGLVKKIGQTKDAKYIAVKPIKETPNHVSSCFGSKSLRAVKQVNRQIFEREPVAYNDQWFDSLCQKHPCLPRE